MSERLPPVAGEVDMEPAPEPRPMGRLAERVMIVGSFRRGAPHLVTRPSAPAFVAAEPDAPTLPRRKP